MLDALRQVPLFAELSDEQLQWLAKQGTEVWLQPGEIHRAEGDPAEHVFVMLEGSVRVTEKVGNQELVLATYGPKTLFGELPILMGMTYFWASGRALSQCHIFELEKDAFWRMLAKIPAVATAILRTMAERVQELQSMNEQREKLIELGTLAAGLAHELNNPVEAVGAGIVYLEEIFQELPSLGLELSKQSMTREQIWLEASLKGIGLLSEIEQNSARISELVQAIKDYSYMDQAPLQEVDVHEGLENTLIILSHKLKSDVVVTREYDRSLPRISAYGSELNQVWTNLIDNAIDAISGQGQIWIRTWREQNQVLVEIADNGMGIPKEIQGRIFEPFFTTKGVGGTGLGLATSYRTVVGKHNGDIRVFSQSEGTHFQVRLPINRE
jgi:signal transduction histidine kinase